MKRLALLALAAWVLLVAPAVANDREIGHLGAHTRSVRTCQRDKLRCVKNGDRLQD